jgi:hypothetical protein
MFLGEFENYNKKKREKNVVYVGAVDCFEQIKLPSSVLITKSSTEATIWLVGTSVYLSSKWICSTTQIVVVEA